MSRNIAEIRRSGGPVRTEKDAGMVGISVRDEKIFPFSVVPKDRVPLNFPDLPMTKRAMDVRNGLGGSPKIVGLYSVPSILYPML